VPDVPRLLHMPKPCDATEKSGACPFRLDAEPDEFPAARYEQLAETAGGPGAEVPIGGPVFACHHTSDGAPVACAGWLAVCGVDHLGVRLAVAEGRLSPEALRRPPDGPALFDSYDDMATQQAAGMYRLGAAEAARRRAGHYRNMLDKVTSRATSRRVCEVDESSSGSGGRDARRRLPS